MLRGAIFWQSSRTHDRNVSGSCGCAATTSTHHLRQNLPCTCPLCTRARQRTRARTPPGSASGPHAVSEMVPQPPLSLRPRTKTRLVAHGCRIHSSCTTRAPPCTRDLRLARDRSRPHATVAIHAALGGAHGSFLHAARRLLRASAAALGRTCMLRRSHHARRVALPPPHGRGCYCRRHHRHRALSGVTSVCLLDCVVSEPRQGAWSHR